jgi:hypothetical protein
MDQLDTGLRTMAAMLNAREDDFIRPKASAVVIALLFRIPSEQRGTREFRASRAVGIPMLSTKDEPAASSQHPARSRVVCGNRGATGRCLRPIVAASATVMKSLRNCRAITAEPIAHAYAQSALA